MSGEEATRLRTSSCRKVFIPRDYSAGADVRFVTKMPQELAGLLDEGKFEEIMSGINAIFAEADALSAKNVLCSSLACLTAYLLYLCTPTTYEKCLQRLNRLIERQNEQVLAPLGLLMIDPRERGFRVIEICVQNNVGGMPGGAS